MLRRPEQPPTADELSAAALQFVRKISGFHKPSKANQEAFDRAVREIAVASDRLLQSVGASSPGRMRGQKGSSGGESQSAGTPASPQ